MNRSIFYQLLFSVFFAIILMASCKSHVRIGEKEVVKDSADINARASDVIRQTLKDLMEEKSVPHGRFLKNLPVLNAIYDQYSYDPQWTNNGSWKPLGDSLLSFIQQVQPYGLFAEDYNLTRLSDLRKKLVTDTAARENKLDAALWAEADLLLTSSFVQLVKHLKAGRLYPDSTLLQMDSSLNNEFYIGRLNDFQSGAPLKAIADNLEPKVKEYVLLKKALERFLKKADFRKFTYINTRDSLHLTAQVKKRLGEDSTIRLKKGDKDSLVVADGIRQFEKRKGLKVDGRLTPAIVEALNATDREKFIRIAINLDRYKSLPSPMPQQYIWVNIPSYYLQVRANDSVLLVSKVVVGKPQTRTPVLTSAITDMITYPQWTIPPSIIKKDVLPGLKKDRSYSARKGFSLIGKDGKEVNPYLVDWSRFQNSIPYRVVQGSGDENALGVMKFNFSNKYSVYLHDTNQRYLFGKKDRALSHGCVRVESWDSLARFILRNDSLAGSKNAVPIDSMQTWLAQKKKRVIPVRNRIPLFIRYFTCEVRDDKIVFYEDVYGEDRRLKEKIFVNKN